MKKIGFPNTISSTQIKKVHFFIVIAWLVILHLGFELLMFFLMKFPFASRDSVKKKYNQVFQLLEKPFNFEINTQTMILLANKNLQAGKNRTLITISAISVGIGVIVCLVSLGYGLESLVISRVAKLEQLRQVDITAKPGSKLKITDEFYSQVKGTSGVVRATPAIILAAKITYQGATSDVPTMSTTKTFLADAGWPVLAGSVIDENEVKKISPSSDTILMPPAEENEAQLVDTLSQEPPATQSALLTPIEEAILTASNQTTSQNISQIKLSDQTVKKAVVNRSLVRSLGQSEKEIVGQKIQVSYVLTGQLLDQSGSRIESVPAEYQIVGVIEDKKTPYMYVSLSDIQMLGVAHYSQLRVVMKDEDFLPKFRQEIETQGYTTTSVVDTVNQIKSLFATLKLFLGSIGVVALSIAALGMFNTLTISLLERTREIGLTKALGMVSEEIERLFLIESLLISLKGGFFGLAFGWLMGKFISLILSLATIPTGFQLINVSYFPWPLVLGIIALSFMVGILTGIYPAKRATKLTALNALRYE